MVKLPFWRDPNQTIKVIEPTEKAMNSYGHGCGSDIVRLKPEHIEALQAGKMLAWNDSEYATFVMLDGQAE